MSTDFSLFGTDLFPLHASALAKLVNCPADAALQLVVAEAEQPVPLPAFDAKLLGAKLKLPKLPVKRRRK